MRSSTRPYFVALVLVTAGSRANADPVACQRAIEAGATRVERLVLQAAARCSRSSAPTPFDACVDFGAATAIPRLRAKWGAQVAAACATTAVPHELGYLGTCAAAPSACTFPTPVLDAPGDQNDVLDCLACRMTESIRNTAATLVADRPAVNHCHTALGGGGLRLLRLTVKAIGDCVRSGQGQSIAACLGLPAVSTKLDAVRTRWRARAQAVCAGVDPFTAVGYPNLCAGISPVPIPGDCAPSAPPCVFPSTHALDAAGDDDDLLDCLTCQANEGALALSRTVQGANLCCTPSGGCRSVLTRDACGAAGGTPVQYRVDSVGPSDLNSPHGVAVRADGTLYVADFGNYRVVTVSPMGDVGVLAANLPAKPAGIGVDAAGTAYVGLRCAHQVVRIDAGGNVGVVAGTGVPGSSGDGGPATAAETVAPNHVALDSAGNVFFTQSGYLGMLCGAALEPGAERVRVVRPDGTIDTVAGTGTLGGLGEGGPALAAQLAIPTEISTAPGGGLLIGEEGLHRILRVDAAGTLRRVAGRPSLFFGSFSGDGGAALDARLFEPIGVVQDGDGNVTAGILELNRVVLVDALGSLVTIAGTGEKSLTASPSGDGGPALQAQLGCPADVAMGPDGRIYVADLWANRIRVLTRQPF